MLSIRLWENLVKHTNRKPIEAALRLRVTTCIDAHCVVLTHLRSAGYSAAYTKRSSELLDEAYAALERFITELKLDER